MSSELEREAPQAAEPDQSEWPRKSWTIGVGMPNLLRLEAFGTRIYDAFGETPWLVGSAAVSKGWRDVDVRLILDDPDYEQLLGARVMPSRLNLRWAVLCDSLSALAHTQTGLPVDFQIQSQAQAEQYAGKVRIPLGMRLI